MAIADRTIDEFLQRVAEGRPTPGGGAVAAVGGAAGAALCEMVCRLSIDHREPGDGADTLEDLAAALSEHRATLLGLADEDVAAVRAAMDGSSDRDRRMLAVPLETAKEGLAVLERSGTVADLGFPPAVGDAGTGALFAHACCRAALQNVRINQASTDTLDDDREITAEVDRLDRAADETLEAVRRTVSDRA